MGWTAAVAGAALGMGMAVWALARGAMAAGWAEALGLAATGLGLMAGGALVAGRRSSAARARATGVAGARPQARRATAGT